jgi:hypothetical protein
MSGKVTEWAWQRAPTLPSATVLVVLLALAEGARPSGKIWQSNAFLARKTHLSARAVSNAIATLAEPSGLNLLRIENGTSKYRVIWLNLSATILFENGPEPDEEPPARYFADLARGSANLAPRSANLAPRANKPKIGTQEDNRASNEALASAGAGDLDFLFDEAQDSESEDVPDAPVAKPTRDPFEVFWACYPKHVDKKAARAAWPVAIAKLSETYVKPETFLIERATALADHLGEETEFAASPERWLRQEKWNDALTRRRKPPRPAHDRGRAVADQRQDDMLAGALEALNRRRGLAGGGSPHGD